MGSLAVPAANRSALETNTRPINLASAFGARLQLPDEGAGTVASVQMPVTSNVAMLLVISYTLTATGRISCPNTEAFHLSCWRHADGSFPERLTKWFR